MTENFQRDLLRKLEELKDEASSLKTLVEIERGRVVEIGRTMDQVMQLAADLENGARPADGAQPVRSFGPPMPEPQPKAKTPEVWGGFGPPAPNC